MVLALVLNEEVALFSDEQRGGHIVGDVQHRQHVVSEGHVAAVGVVPGQVVVVLRVAAPRTLVELH